MSTRFFGSANPADNDISASTPREQNSPSDVVLEKRLALLVGNSRYKVAPLANPGQDIELIGDVLASLGFSVTLVKDADKAAFQSAVGAFQAQLDAADHGAVALFYFAGHGMQYGGVNYLLPVDLDLPSGHYLRQRALSLDEVVSSLGRRRRKATVVVLDACRSAPADISYIDQHLTEGLAALASTPDDMLVAYSTAAGAVADDGDRTNSPYATALAQALPAVLEPNRRLHDVFIEASDRVRLATGGKQNPALYLQGSLPALTISEADLRRFKTWVFRRRKSKREWLIQKVGILAIAAIILIPAALFLSFEPEIRALTWHRLGIKKSDMFEFNCERPPDVVDRYGLTSADWCLDGLAAATLKVKAAGLWDGEVLQRLEIGDPNAMALRAAEINARRPQAGSQEAIEACGFATRASITNLAAWPDVYICNARGAKNGIRLSKEAIERGLDQSAGSGVMPAIYLWALKLWDDGNVKEALRAFNIGHERTKRSDFALAAAEKMMEGSPAANLGPSVPRAVAWLKRACERGDSQALQRLDDLQARGLAAWTADERIACVDQVAAKDGRTGRLLRGRQLVKSGSPSEIVRAAELLQQAAKAGSVEAMLDLAALHETGKLGAKSSPSEAFEWVETAYRKGSQAAAIELGKYLGWGLPDGDGRPRIALDRERAWLLLEPRARNGSPAAAIELAELLAKGAYGENRQSDALAMAEIARKSGKDDQTIVERARRVTELLRRGG